MKTKESWVPDWHKSYNRMKARLTPTHDEMRLARLCYSVEQINFYVAYMAGMRAQDRAKAKKVKK